MFRTDTSRRRPRSLALGFVAAITTFSVAAAGCVASSDSAQSGGDAPKGCEVIQTTVSPEKGDLMTSLAAEFNATNGAKKAANGGCAFVKVSPLSSGAGATALADDWRDTDAYGAKPTVWSPSASSWGGVVNQRLADAGKPAYAPSSAQPFMLTPLVIAMPKPMADALGYPAKPLGFDDLIALSKNPAGWGSVGHPEWGPFKLGKTNPNFSTSALNATTAQYYTAAKKTSGLSLEDVNKPEVAAYNTSIESSVVHYGDTTLTFLNNWFRTDQRGTSLTYVSAVAVEEKSVIDYNLGNPDGVLEQGEKPRPPRIPLVAVYPKDGTLFSDNPFYVLDAPWVTPKAKAGAAAFGAFVQTEAHQKRVLEFGFRPANPAVPVDKPITKDNGVDPSQPATTLGVPEPAVLTAIIKKWGEQRKGAQVMLVIDVSGSMGEPAADDGRTRLDLAKSAAIASLDQFSQSDLVGLRIFSTGIGANAGPYVDLVPIGPIATTREQIAVKIRSLIPTRGTPLYTTAIDSVAAVKARYDATRINAVVLLTDGKNEDPFDDLAATLAKLGNGTEGGSAQPVRLFTIGFGVDADQSTLKRLSEATDAKAYDAKNAKKIDQVFANVISNF